jgi:type III secretory pathway component EscV
MGTILEALVEGAAVNKNPVSLVEAARHSLGRALIRPLLNASGQLKVVTLDRAIEEECARTSMQHPQLAAGGTIQISVARRVLDGLRAMFGDQIALAPATGAFYSQDCGDLPLGDPRDDTSAVDWFGQITEFGMHRLSEVNA